MERRIAMLSALLEAMQSMQAAAKPLYATLTDEQKKVADELMIEHVMAMRARGL
jgi:LTXXQ motif family protein